MNQNSLELALIALSERSKVCQQLLKTHLQQAQDQLQEAKNQLANIEMRLDHLLSIVCRESGTPVRIDAGDEVLSLVEKIDLLESVVGQAYLQD